MTEDASPLFSELAEHHDYKADLKLAKEVFDRIVYRGATNSPGIRVHQSPFALFSGDMALACYCPDGSLHMMLMDFTGHGLSAALGAVPSSEIFYGMTTKGYLPRDILRELNKRLKDVMPVEHFCCTAFIHLIPSQSRFSVWNGGIPSVTLVSPESEALHFESKHMPLGILDEKSFDDEMEYHSFSSEDYLLSWSDGVNESMDEDGNMLGMEAIEAIIDSVSPPEVFDKILEAVNGHTGQLSDDVTLVEFALGKVKSNSRLPDRINALLPGPTKYCQSFYFEGKALRHYNPLPMLHRNLIESSKLRLAAGPLYTILSELFTNALEHGLLDLKSDVKDTPDGWQLYNDEKQARLLSLDKGFIRVVFEYNETPDGCNAIIRVTDSGQGFPVESQFNVNSMDSLLETGSGGGRGIALLQLLCESVWYEDGGRTTCVLFRPGALE